MRLAFARPRRSFVGGLDAVAGAGLALVAFGVFAYSLQQFSFARRLADERRTVRMAAESELAWLRAVGVDDSGRPAIAPPPTRVEMDIERVTMPGTDAWSGFALVRITAQRIGPGYGAVAVLSGYVPVVQSSRGADETELQPAGAQP